MKGIEHTAKDLDTGALWGSAQLKTRLMKPVLLSKFGKERCGSVSFLSSFTKGFLFQRAYLAGLSLSP